MLDLVIRNGHIVDGTGNAAFAGDVGIVGNRIVAVGAVDDRARRTLDADGLTVTPGFVDIHTHYDGQVSWDSQLAPSSSNGVTSVVMGNCGVGFAPARREHHEFLIALLEGVEDIPGTALAEGLTWDWESFPDYLDALAARRYTVDIGTQMPHAALRAFVMGERGADHEVHPDEDEIRAMRSLTAEAIAAGALGFTTSRTYVHRTRSGENIGTLKAGYDELMGIAEALRDQGTGVIQLISDAYLTADDDFAGQELDLIEALARHTAAPLSFTVQQTDDAPDRHGFIFERVERMNAAGLNVRTQVAPRPIGVLHSFAATTNPFFATPTYRALKARSQAERLQALARPEVRERILAEHAAYEMGGLARTLTKGFDRLFRMGETVDYEPLLEDSLAEEARRAGVDPARYVYDVLLEAGGHRLLYMPLVNYARGNLNDVYDMMTAPHALYGLSDGGAHCGTICDGSFPTTTLALWSHGNRAGKRIPLETLVHGYTQRNARHVGWHDRGVVAPGYLADLNVLDVDALQLTPPEIVQDLPAGGTRLLQSAAGYRWTLKGGAVTFAAGEATGALPGGLVRGSTRLD